VHKIRIALTAGAAALAASIAVSAGVPVAAAAKKPPPPQKVAVTIDLSANKAADGTLTFRWIWASKVRACVSPARIAAREKRGFMHTNGWTYPGPGASDAKFFPTRVGLGVYEVVLPPSTTIPVDFTTDNGKETRNLPTSEANGVYLSHGVLLGGRVTTRKNGERVPIQCKPSRFLHGPVFLL
jgi:hypothetical protein